MKLAIPIDFEVGGAILCSQKSSAVERFTTVGRLTPLRSKLSEVNCRGCRMRETPSIYKKERSWRLTLPAGELIPDATSRSIWAIRRETTNKFP
jgi:hypothetical protein